MLYEIVRITDRVRLDKSDDYSKQRIGKIGHIHKTMKVGEPIFFEYYDNHTTMVSSSIVGLSQIDEMCIITTENSVYYLKQIAKV